MTTGSEGVAVIATQLAHTDRRALSEAWYSALHLARDASPAGSAALHGATPVPLSRQHAAKPPSSASTRDVPRLSSRAEDCTAIRSRGTATIDRRRPPTEIAQRIERAVAALGVRRPLPAAHTVDVGDGRVRLLVHADGRCTRIVALCRPELRERVERALAHARFTLAGRGIAVGAP